MRGGENCGVAGDCICVLQRAVMRCHSVHLCVARWGTFVTLLVVFVTALASFRWGVRLLSADHETCILITSGSVNFDQSGWWPGGRVSWFPALKCQWRKVILPMRRANDGIYVPLWIPLVIALIPTIWLWRGSRQILPGVCSCGYDLTGNVSGVCPECGERRQDQQRVVDESSGQ